MCRFVLYLGPPIRLSSLITEPTHSLIRQATHSRKRREPLNGDGFGVVWYVPEAGEVPARFRSVTPAWNNGNLRDVARVVSSGCILAHVRAASRGFTAGDANCHPFRHGRWSFMHNGDLAGFHHLRRELLARLSDEAFHMIEGQTDSEHLFALFLDEIRGEGDDPPLGAVAAALRRALGTALELSRAHGSDDEAPSLLNVAVCDGRRAVVTRYSSRADHEGESLYVSAGGRYSCDDGVCAMRPDPSGEAAIVCSEPLSTDESWRPVPRDSVVCVDEGGALDVQPF